MKDFCLGNESGIKSANKEVYALSHYTSRYMELFDTGLLVKSWCKILDYFYVMLGIKTAQMCCSQKDVMSALDFFSRLVGCARVKLKKKLQAN